MKHSKEGWRVRLLKGSHYHMWTGEEGVLVEKKSNQPAWPFVIRLDLGETIELDEGQFEFIGPAEPGMVPPAPQPQPADQGSEEVVTKTATKQKVASLARERAKKDAKTKAASAGRVALKRSPATARVPLKQEPTRRVPVRQPAKGRSNVVPLKTKGKAPEKGKAKPRMSWPEAILKVMDGRKNVKLPEIYAGVRKLIGEPNANFTATVRQSLQAMARQGKTHMTRPGVWSTLKQKG